LNHGTRTYSGYHKHVREEVMTIEKQLHSEMLALYQRAGEAVGYWGGRYLQAVRRKGGYATAQDMLKPRNAGQRAGLDKLLEARRPDLTLEHLILKRKYRALFSTGELRIARERLGQLERDGKNVRRERIYPDDLELGKTYAEGAKKQVRVNAYERDPRARRACIKAHGSKCAVCDVSMVQRYGPLGRHFIHVHHVKPLARVRKGYRVDPKRDLIPVCPNCHAMLHRKDPPLTVKRLRSRVAALSR